MNFNGYNDFSGSNDGEKEVGQGFEDFLVELACDLKQEEVKLEEEQCMKENRFPVEVFPIPIQQVINKCHQHLLFPVDFTSAAIIYAFSIAIGITHLVEVMRGWIESAVVYITLVGRSGTHKSAPLHFALKPVMEKDKATYKVYETEGEQYCHAQQLTKKEREAQGISISPTKPIWKKFLLSDYTPEALASLHKMNRRGIGVFVDELVGWFKNFNRYQKGSEQEFWLSVFSGKPINIDRKSSDSILISRPFISVIGTIQNAVLFEMSKDGRNYNGFLDRILFVIPKHLKKHPWSEDQISDAIIEDYANIINKLIDIPLSVDENEEPVPDVLRYTEAAKVILNAWQKENAEASNEEMNDAFSGVYAKLETYIVRLSLILQMSYWATGEEGKEAIGIRAVRGAIKLIEYFRNTAEEMHNIIDNPNPLHALPEDKQEVYNCLPDAFTTEEGLQIASDLKVPERSFKRFLTNRKLFEKRSRGLYQKKLD